MYPGRHKFTLVLAALRNQAAGSSSHLRLHCMAPLASLAVWSDQLAALRTAQLFQFAGAFRARSNSSHISPPYAKEIVSTVHPRAAYVQRTAAPTWGQSSGAQVIDDSPTYAGAFMIVRRCSSTNHFDAQA